MSEEQYEKAAAIKAELDSLKCMICDSERLVKCKRINKIIVKKECIFSKKQDDFVFNVSQELSDAITDVIKARIKTLEEQFALL